MTGREPLGVDLALGRTGYAAAREVGSMVAPTSFPGRRDSWAQNGQRLRWWANRLHSLLELHRPSIVVTESALLMPGSGRLSTLHLHGVLRLVAADHHLRVVECPPSTLKKWATGNGFAEKPAMVQAARDRGADIGTKPGPKGTIVGDDDAADAYLLRAWWLARDAIRGESEAV